jgi:hypothetical protein
MTIIASLTLSAIAIGAFGLMGVYGGGYVDFALSDRSFGYVQSSAALFRFYWFNTDEDAYLSPSQAARYQTLRRRSDNAPVVRYRHGSPLNVRPYAFFWNRAPGRPAVTGTQVRMTGVRTWVYLPVALLLAYPAFAVGRDRWKVYRRPKEGFCQQCAYDLTGNTTGVCPECGAPVNAQP